MNITVAVGKGAGQVAFGNESPLALIAGPCVIETEEHVLRMAKAVREIVGPFVSKHHSIRPIAAASVPIVVLG